MARGGRFSDAVARWLWIVGAPVLAISILVLAVQDVGPAYRARFASGSPGTFTAMTEDCGRSSCQWRGDFRPSAHGTVRIDVGIGSGAPTLNRGQSIAAIDTGDSALVYPVGGGRDWLIITVTGLASVALLAVWGTTMAAMSRRRRGP